MSIKETILGGLFGLAVVIEVVRYGLGDRGSLRETTGVGDVAMTTGAMLVAGMAPASAVTPSGEAASIPVIQ